jgi:hypothetical protein
MEVVVNVLLPVVYALGQARGDDTLSAAALRCYRRFPATPGNRITHAMLEQVAGGMAAHVPLTACRQQGLLHLYHQWCAERWCARCPADSGGRPRRRCPSPDGVTDHASRRGARETFSTGPAPEPVLHSDPDAGDGAR